jgi:hypothetical protein
VAEGEEEDEAKGRVAAAVGVDGATAAAAAAAAAAATADAAAVLLLLRARREAARAGRWVRDAWAGPGAIRRARARAAEGCRWWAWCKSVALSLAHSLFLSSVDKRRSCAGTSELGDVSRKWSCD